MTVTDVDTDADVIAWRLHCLLEAGYSPAAAERLADRHNGPDAIDLHQACELVEAGCTPELAERILA